MAENLGKATFALETDVSKFKSQLGQAKGAANQATQGIGQKFQSMGAGLTQAGKGLSLAITAPIVGAIAISGKAFLDFDQSLNRIRFLTNATAEDLPKIEAAVLDIAKATGTLPTEAAGAFYFALSSGAKDAAQASAVLSQTLIAANMGLGEAEVVTRAVLSVINAYNLDMTEATVVTGQFVEMIEGGLAEPDELAQSLNRVLSVFKAMNVEIPQLFSGIAAMTVLTGASGPRAISKMAGAMRSLLRLSPRQREMFADWKSDTEGVGDGILGLTDLIQVDFGLAMKAIFDHFDGNTAQIKRFVGNVEALDVVLNIGSERGFKLYNEGLANMGTAGEDFLKKQEAFRKTNEFQLKELQVVWQTTLIEVGESFVGLLIPLTKVFKAFFKVISIGVAVFDALPAPLKLAIIGFLLLIAAIGPLLLIAGLLIGSIGGIIIGFSVLTATTGFTIAGLLAFLGTALVVAVVVALLGFAILALVAHFDDIKDAIGAVLEPLSKLVKGAKRLGFEMIVGFTKGVAAAAQGLFRVVQDIVNVLVRMLNPFNWVFGSDMEDIYHDAGEVAGEAMMDGMGDSVEEGVTVVVEELKELADPGLLRAIARAIERGMGGLTEAFRRPLDAMRGIINDLTSELNRLVALPTLESLTEDLERAELQLKKFDDAADLRKGEKRIKKIDEEMQKLVDQRNMMVFLAKGRTDATDVIDDQIRALVKEKKEVEESNEKSQEKVDAIDEEIDAIERLGDKRDLEREILAIRAQLQDQTLATDHQVIDQLERMAGTVKEVTGALAEQVTNLQTQFLPAWADVIETLENAGAAGADAGGGADDELEFPEFGELDPFGEAGFDFDDPFGDIKENLEFELKKLVRKLAPIFVLAGIALIAAFLSPFAIPLVLAAAVGALIGLLIVLFQKPVLKFLKKLAKKALKLVTKLWDDIVKPIIDSLDDVLGFLKKNWPEIVTLLSGPFLPIVALATDAFGIRSALIDSFGEVKDFITGAVSDVADAITGAFSDVIDWITVNWADVIAEIILSPFFLLRVGADDLWGIRTFIFDAFNSIIAFVKNAMTTFKDLWFSAWVAMNVFVKDTLITIKDTVFNAFEAMFQFAKDAFTKIKDFIIFTLTELPGIVFGLALSIGTAIVNAILQALGFLTEVRTRIIGVLLDILVSVPGIALDIGKAMFDGIVSGLGDIASAIWDKLPSPLRWLIEQLSLGIDIAGEIAGSIPGGGVVADVISFGGGLFGGGRHGILEVGGSGSRDTQPRALTPGEMVLPRDSAEVLRDFFASGSERGGGGDINVTVHNPQPEAAEDTVRRRLQALAQLGVGED